MKKILLIIIHLISIKCQCYQSCLTCESPSTADEMNCEECANGYYKMDGTNNCYNEDDIPENYYFDSNENKYYQCDVACKTCYGKKLSDVNTNCQTCDKDNDYYPIFGLFTFCKNKNEELENYYFDETHKDFRRCYITCNKCSSSGDETNHNCLECLTYYYQDGTNCYSECPDYLFTYGFTCVSTCPSGYLLDLFSKSCLSSCPTGTDKNSDLGICAISTTDLYENMECDDIIENIILVNMKYYISANSFIPGKNCYIQVYNAIDQNSIHSVAQKKYLSKLFLNSEYLNSNTIVIKIDYNKTYVKKPEVNDIKFKLYNKVSDDVYNEITGLNLIRKKDSTDLIYIEKPFIFLEYIEVYKEKYEVFDIFNARDEVYNNFCKDFTTEYGTDLTYDYRRDNYFVNISNLCLNDSTIYYSGFNSETISIQCKANYMQNKFTGEEKVGGSRYKIFRCTEYLSEDLGVNLGFWIIFIIILFNIAIGYFFWRAPFTKIINFLRVFEREYNKPTGLILKWTSLNPPKKNVKIIYEPKEFILDKELKDHENEIQFGKYLDQYYRQRQIRQKKLDKIQNNRKEPDKNLNLKGVMENEHTSSSVEYTMSLKDISYSEKDKESNSQIKKMRKMEEEKRILNKKKKEYLNFMEDAHQKDKAFFAKNVYNKSLNIPKAEMDKVMENYNKQQNKIKEEKVIKTNLLFINKAGNAEMNPEVDINPNNFNMKYEPKEFLDKYMFHNFGHLLPVPKSERVSSGSLSSDIRNELQKLQQLREKKMVETIFLKKLFYNQKLIKGYNEDFYPFSFDECIIRRKETVTYLIVFWNYLKEVNLIVNVIFDYNFLENWFLKIILLGFEIYCFIFFNLIFYTDDYINDFYTNKGKYNFIFQITKSIYASLCTVVVIKLASLLISCKDRFRNIIIKRRYESDDEFRKQYKFWIIILVIKNCVFYLILVALIIFGWVYYMCFSVPYRHSSAYVLVGTCFSILIYEILSIGVIALVSKIKYSSIKAQNRKFYNIMMIVNKFL